MEHGLVIIKTSIRNTKLHILTQDNKTNRQIFDKPNIYKHIFSFIY